MTELTEKQQEVLTFIVQFRKIHGYSPSTREIGDHFKIAQTAAVNHVKALERKGAVTTKEGQARTIVPVV